MSSINSFHDLQLNAWIIRQCESIGLRVPTPIQKNCIPPILAGRDCVGAAKTGSGKTLAFALPIIQKLCEDPYGIFALILTPTRELAYQIADQFAVIGRAMNLKQSVIVGGIDMITQSQELARKPHIVIATPGRLCDQLDSCDTFSLKKVKFLVLDEADRLLEGGFDRHLKTIFASLPDSKQTLLFSATITDALVKVKEVSKNEVFLFEAPAEIATVVSLDQFYVLCAYDVRDGYLVQVVQTFRKSNPHGSIMIFTDTCMNCQVLSMMLNQVGFENMALHSMMSQRHRLATLSSFKSSTIKILIATDVASRGLDIPTVELVLNHAMPLVPKTYIHRVGRTARAGRKGTAITLVHPRDIQLLHDVEDAINTKLTEYKVDDKEVVKIVTQVLVTRRVAETKLEEADFYEKKNNYKRKALILEGKDPDKVEQKLEKLKKLQRKNERKARRERVKAAKSQSTNKE